MEVNTKKLHKLLSTLRFNLNKKSIKDDCLNSFLEKEVSKTFIFVVSIFFKYSFFRFLMKKKSIKFINI